MKRLRNIVFWFLGSLFALFMVLSAIVYIAVLRDENRIKKIVVDELNKSLTGTVSVEQMNLTFWSSFPYIALEFKNVKAMGSNPKDTEPLLEAEYLSFNFNLRDMLAKKYEVKKIELNGAIVCIKLYADNSGNYNLWKSSGTTSSDFSFALKKIQFKNTQFNFVNTNSEQRYELYFYRANAKGDFSSNLQNISLSGDLFLELLQSGETVILSKKSMSLRTQMTVDNAHETIHFLDGFLRLENLNFDLLGFVNYSDDAPNMDLEITGKNLDLHKFVKQIPSDFVKQIEDYRTEGDFDFRLQLSGNYSPNKLPEISAEWAFRNGQIYEKNTQTYFENVQFSGVFSTSDVNHLPNYQLQIRDFSARLQDGAIAGNFTIRNFQSPVIQLNTTFNVGLRELNRWIDIPKINDLNGRSNGRISYSHQFKSFDSIRFPEILNGRLQAELACRNVICKVSDSLVKSPIRIDTACFRIHLNQLQIPILNGEFEDSKIHASLFVHNFLTALETPELMHVSGDINIDRIQIDQVQLQNIQTSMQYQNRILSLEKFSTRVWDGDIRGIAEIDCADTSRLPFRFDGIFSHINAEKILTDFDNFDQSEITDKNLKGFIDADLSVLGIYLPSSGLDLNSLLVTMKTKISNGELKNVAMLQKLSRFVDEETLNHVKFETLENTLEIKHKTITFPEMKIRSNALNIHVSGIHDFDGKIDYNIKIALSELLSKRRRERRKNQVESGVMNDEKKRTNLFVYVTGTTEHPKFRYDIQNVFKKLELGSNAASKALKQEKETVKTIFKEEFQFLQKSEETKRQEALWREQEKGKFVIEWDGNSSDTLVNTPVPKKASSKKDTVKIGVVFEDE